MRRLSLEALEEPLFPQFVLEVDWSVVFLQVLQKDSAFESSQGGVGSERTIFDELNVAALALYSRRLLLGLWLFLVAIT